MKIKKISKKDAYSCDGDWENYQLGREILSIENLEIWKDGWSSAKIVFVPVEYDPRHTLNDPFHFAYVKFTEE